VTDAARATSDADDRELIRRCQDGDVAAFEPLVEKYRQRVWRLAYQILRDREEAWDCAQEAFVRAFSSLGSFRGQSAFYTWLFRITVNVATDRHRSRGARTRAFGGEAVSEDEWERTAVDAEEGPDDAALRSEERERIERALDSLPPKARTIIILSDIEGLSYREIAAVLNCPMGTVMSRLHNARRRLRERLGPLLALVLWLSLGLVAVAGPAAAGDAMVNFGVRVLQASSAPMALTPNGRISAPIPEPEADERLQRILPRLRSLFRYSDYTTIDRQRAQVSIGTQQRFFLPGARQLEVVPDELLGGQAVRMRVRLMKGEQPELRAVLVAAPGAPAVLGGPSHGDGVLIIILWANPASTVPDR